VEADRHHDVAEVGQRVFLQIGGAGQFNGLGGLGEGELSHRGADRVQAVQ
jgi:hypothetical protein